jgi:GNAT superfamily N-acetyltransferase
MRIEITTDAAAFQALVEPFIRRDPLRHTVIATALANHMAGLRADAATSRFLSVHADDATVIGVAMRVGGHDAYLGELPPGSVGAVAEAMVDADGVEGVVDDAAEFVEHWAALRGIRSGGATFRPDYVVELYRLGSLRVPEVPGSPRRARTSDAALCAEWAEAMRVESGMRPPSMTVAAIRSRVATGRWWLWERHGRPVCLAAHQVPVFGWSRIGPVYTPPAQRRQGYAAVLTAHVAHTLRVKGLDVCLFADRTNTTAKKIYRDIGFEPTREFAHYTFG